jgi:hypothetical protein
MRIDIFEFLEGLIRGLIFFIYNFFETIWRLTASPNRGVLRLYRASADPHRKQLGGLTFLFLLFFLVAIARTPALLAAVGFGDVRGSLLRAVNATPRLGSDVFWAPIAGALAATMIVDAPCRLLLTWRWPNRPVRRRILLAGFEYLLTWPVLVLFGAELASVWHNRALASLPNPMLGLVLFMAGVTLVLLVARPAAAWLIAMARPDGAPERGRRRGVRTLAVVLTITLAYAAMTAGEGLGNLMARQTERDVKQAAPLPRLEPIALHCSLTKPAYADLVLVNLVNYPVTVDPTADLKIEFYRTDRTGVRIEPSLPARVTEVDAAAPRIILFGGKEGKLMRLSLELGTNPDSSFDHCGIIGGRGEVQLAPLTSWLERESKW